MGIMNKPLQIKKLKKLAGSKSDLFDFKAEVDGRLTYPENKRLILKKLNKRGIKTKTTVKRRVRSSNLVLKALNLNKRRSKRSIATDGTRKSKRTFKARDLNKKQFIKWSINKSKYDIEGVDSVGTHIKKKNISKDAAKKLLRTLDFDDDLF
jgi:hypothetical protein